MNSSLLCITANEGVAVLSLTRPEKRNALNIPLLLELLSAIRQLEEDRRARVIIFRGEGSVFCAGMDLQEAADPAYSEESGHALAKTFTAIALSRLVTIAAVHGHALGGGAGLMSACDLVIAEDTTKIGYPEVRRGLAAALVLVFLRRQAGDRACRELLLTGEAITAQRALDIGLITRVVPAGSLMAAATDLASQVVLGGPHAQGHIKRFLQELSPTDLAAEISRALVLHSQIRNSDEAREGIQAFLDRRPPNFSRT